MVGIRHSRPWQWWVVHSHGTFRLAQSLEKKMKEEGLFYGTIYLSCVVLVLFGLV